MCKLMQTALVILYILLIVSLFLLILRLSGVYISWMAFFITFTGWLLFCFTAVHFQAAPYLFFRGNLRKPILEEEVRLTDCLNEVLQNAGCQKKFRLRIIETKEYDRLAYGTDIIAISRSLLLRLTDEELRGILAHESGHLLSKDTTVCQAFVTASLLPQLLFWPIRLKMLQIIPLTCLSILLIFFTALFKPMLLLFILTTLLLLLIFYLLHRLFCWLMLIISRLTEYRQDLFAHQSGHGAGLMNALKKIADYGSERVNIYFILMNGHAPIIYNRIRKLEALEGMRDECFNKT